MIATIGAQRRERAEGEKQHGKCEFGRRRELLGDHAGYTRRLRCDSEHHKRQLGDGFCREEIVV